MNDPENPQEPQPTQPQPEPAQQQNNAARKASLVPPEPKPEHPPSNYTVFELYMIRKESLGTANELIKKRLFRAFQKYKQAKIEREKQKDKEKQKLETEANENSRIKNSFRRVHELYKKGSKVDEIIKQKRQKMKNRVQKVQKALSKDQFHLARNIDISKIYIRPSHSQNSSQKVLQK